MILLDGVATRDALLTHVSARCSAFTRPPCLRVFLVGDDSASELYVRLKSEACSGVGIRCELSRFHADVETAVLEAEVAAADACPAVDGILVQLPLPAQDEARVLACISPRKDVDGLHPASLGKAYLTTPGRFVSCTAAGIMHLLATYGVPVRGRHAVVVGRSPVAGLPVSALLQAADATVTVCHSHTPPALLASMVQAADIIVAAAGVRGLLRGPFKPGSCVVDVGVHRSDDPEAPNGYRVHGDVAEEALAGVGFYTPVPGGVGPMTIAMLCKHVVEAAAAAPPPNPDPPRRALAPLVAIAAVALAAALAVSRRRS